MLLILNNLLPIFLIILLGVVLRYFGWMTDSFINMTDRMVYFVFFPALLFWKACKPADDFNIEPGLILLISGVVFLMFVTSIGLSRILGMADFEVGSFSQCCFRFNSYVGMAVTFSVLGDQGGRIFAVLISIIIPFINVLVISTMIFYSGNKTDGRSKIVMVAWGMLSNPLIIACFAGIFYSRLHVPLPAVIDNTLALVSALTLPLALMSVGGSLRISGQGKYIGKAAAAGIVKLFVMPAVGYFFLKHMNVSNIGFEMAMIYFALPTSPQNHILASQLNSSVELATSGILISTIFSVLSLSAVLIILS